MRTYFILLFLMLLTLTGCDTDTQTIYDEVDFSKENVDGNKILNKILLNISQDYPGRGLADYPSDAPADVPKSYALILLGAIDEAKKEGLHEINQLGVKAGDWLIKESDTNGNGIIGWGVPIAWDAYGDGTINPENTEYSISTAIVVDALLSWVNFVDDTKKSEIFSLVESAFLPYLTEDMRTPDGLLPYSLLPSDRVYDTFNSATYLAGQMQRFSQLTPNDELKNDLELAADSTMQSLLDNKRKSEGYKAWYWNYSIQEDSPNDLPHAGYIIEGVLTYIENEGRLGADFDQEKVFLHLMEFFDDNGKLRGWPNFKPEISTEPRLYDLSIAAQLMCRYKNYNVGSLFLSELERYESPEGGYLKYPYGTEVNKQVAEYESYLYRALKSCGFNENAK